MKHNIDLPRMGLAASGQTFVNWCRGSWLSSPARRASLLTRRLASLEQPKTHRVCVAVLAVSAAAGSPLSAFSASAARLLSVVSELAAQHSGQRFRLKRS